MIVGLCRSRPWTTKIFATNHQPVTSGITFAFLGNCMRMINLARGKTWHHSIHHLKSDKLVNQLALEIHVVCFIHFCRPKIFIASKIQGEI